MRRPLRLVAARTSHTLPLLGESVASQVLTGAATARTRAPSLSERGRRAHVRLRRQNAGVTNGLAEYRVFLDAARRLQHTVEVAAKVPLPEGPSVNEVRMVVAEVLSAGWRLAEVEPITDELLPSAVSQQQWCAVFAGLCDWIGEFEYYSTNLVLRGRDGDDVTLGSVADDLADIWRDLTDALEADKQGVSWQDVAWEVRFGLQTHWGKHAVEVLRALHDL